MEEDTYQVGLPPGSPDPNDALNIGHVGDSPLALECPPPPPPADTADTDTDTASEGAAPETVPEAVETPTAGIQFGLSMPMESLDILHKMLNGSLTEIKYLANETNDTVGATPLSVITMTAVFSMNREFKLSKVPSRGMFDVIKKTDYDGDVVEPKMQALIDSMLDCEVKVRHPTHEDSFSNCFLLKYESERFVNNHGIKVFPTGKIHTTGAVNLIEAREACIFVCGMMDILKGREDGTHELMDYSVNMMNTGFNVSKGLKLEALADYVQRVHHPMRVDYDIQQRTSLKVVVYLGDMFTPVNYMLYGCGKVMISGKIQDPRLLVEAFKRIIAVLTDAWDECSTPLTPQQQLELKNLLQHDDGDVEGSNKRIRRRRSVVKITSVEKKQRFQSG